MQLVELGQEIDEMSTEMLGEVPAGGAPSLADHVPELSVSSRPS
jgi:hypothetical protein